MRVKLKDTCEAYRYCVDILPEEIKAKIENLEQTYYDGQKILPGDYIMIWSNGFTNIVTEQYFNSHFKIIETK